MNIIRHIKNHLFVLPIAILCSCSADNDEAIKQIDVTLNFTHYMDTLAIDQSDFNKLNLTNKKGNVLSIERLRYLVSKVILVNDGGDTTQLKNYQLIDLNDPESLTLKSSETIKEGNYALSFTFGFDNEDNKDGAYADLNTASWNVPAALNGGYHFMQLDGKYKDKNNQEAPYNYHAIQAYDTVKKEPSSNTFFTINLGSSSLNNSATIDIKMDISKWFKGTHDWDLNEYNTNLMGNHEVQKKMADNGKNTFSLVSVNQ